ncbi:MAG: hypothetical protein WCO66_02970 [Candidatus Absconditabacteria bacterium]
MASKTLFVCRGNVGRSQMAAELFAKNTKTEPYSAGTNVFEKENEKLKDIPLAEPVIRFMKAEGIDVSENERTQITPELATQFEKIIVMAEPEHIPEYLLNNTKVEIREVLDPKGMDDAGYIEVIKEIKNRLEILMQ